MKLIKLLTIASLIFLTSCVSHNPKRIVIWNQMNAKERETLQKHLAIFSQRYPDWEFKELYYETEELRTNYQIAALGGSGPALIHGPSDNVGPMVDLGVLQPMEELLDTAYINTFVQSPVNSLTWLNGHLYQVADQVGNHLCLVYNKKFIKDPPKTMGELIEIGRKTVRDLDNDGFPDQYALAWNYVEPYFFFPFFSGYGGRIFDENGIPELNSPAAVNAMKLILRLRNDEKIIPKECNQDLAQSMFKEDRALMVIDGPWSWSGYRQAGVDFGVARIPMIDETGKWPSPMVSPRGYSMNPNLDPDQKRITIELLRYLTQTDVDIEVAMNNVVIPSNKIALNSPQVRGNEILQASIDQMLVGQTLPVKTELRAVWDGMRKGYQAVLNGSLTPEEAAQSMQEETVKRIRDLRN